VEGYVTEPFDARRLELVAAAQRQWTDALTDLGGRNTLLYYKDRRAGTLDLADADPDVLERFEKNGSIRLTRLFHDADIRADAIRRMQTIHRKARELAEERGINAGYLATGLARWDELFLEPAAPVLLRALTITPTRARYDDFDLTLDDEVEVNPVLLHKLASQFGAVVEKPAPDRIAGQLARAAAVAEIPGFAILRRKVIGTFTYAKLPMVRDLEAAGDLLADSDLVAAIAGDAEAQEFVGADHCQLARQADAPEDDYSVLDADSSQRSAIDAVVAGRSLVIHGPPGTGKSQTIANLVAAMVVRGRKVLFVAEKRAAIDAVLSRLVGVNLGDLVLDIHEGTRDRQRIAADLGATLDLAEHATAPDTAALHRRLTDRQQRLTRHAAALHRVHEPWRLSAYQVQAALLGVPAAARVTARLAAPEDITPDLADEIRDALREFHRLGGFALRPGSTPWFGAAIRTREQAREAVDLATTISGRTLPLLDAKLAAACRETGLPIPATYPERSRLTHLFSLLSDAESPGRGFRERRALRKDARAEWDALVAPGTPGAGNEPRLPSGYPALVQAWREFSAQLTALAKFAPFAGLEQDPAQASAVLAADEETPWRLPRLYELVRRFGALGLAPLLDEVGSGPMALEPTGADVLAGAFDYAWYRTILDQIRVNDPEYGAEYGAALDEIADEFRRRDTEHLEANRARVRSVWAHQLREAVDRHPLQARVIRKQAALRRGHLPLRRLLDQTGDVLFALKPCWAMSPLMVSQVLPLTRLFDLVIFDEASQIVPADAIGSMIRAHQVVVAGDDRQLPPTNFFRQVDSGDPNDDDDSDEGTVSFGAGFESVLDALRPLLPTCPLNWHYRSRDERLVAFSNDRIYGGALTTFPGVARDDCLRHVVVAQDARPGQESSVSAEVAEVVNLILEHARTRPQESLGVIALGMRHAERIDLAVRAALASAAVSPEVEVFFAEDVPEPFFVKNLERVQGDERDAIILSVGYGKHADGRMRYQWGPLLRNGGERRLNVAATRAKHRLTVVSSFSSHDVDPGRLTKPGARLLAEYLEYAGTGGTPVAASGSRSSVGPFEENVASRLAELGITVVPQYGVGGYRVDFAAAHPDDPSRMILAIEADGASYRDSGSVRDRDRLRKEHLERLGWRVHRLWSTSWFTDPDTELAKLRAAYDSAVLANPPAPPPPREPPAPDATPAPRAGSAPQADPAPRADPAADSSRSAPSATPPAQATPGNSAPPAGSTPPVDQSRPREPLPSVDQPEPREPLPSADPKPALAGRRVFALPAGQPPVPPALPPTQKPHNGHPELDRA
jgi:very-short-patch-repair endonuclease